MILVVSISIMLFCCMFAFALAGLFVFFLLPVRWMLAALYISCQRTNKLVNKDCTVIW